MDSSEVALDVARHRLANLRVCEDERSPLKGKNVVKKIVCILCVSSSLQIFKGAYNPPF
jgi:hypothetical protein